MYRNTPENFPFPTNHQLLKSCVANKINISQRPSGHRHLGFLRSGTFQRAERLGQRWEASGRLHESPPLIQTHEENADLGIFMMGKLGGNVSLEKKQKKYRKLSVYSGSIFC